MADAADAPSVKDLPKLDDTIQDELKDVQLKHIEVRTESLEILLALLVPCAVMGALSLLLLT